MYAMAVGTNIPSIVFSGLTTEPMGIEAISPNRQEIGEQDNYVLL